MPSVYSGQTALVIDDQAFVRRTVAAMLNHIGFSTVVEANDGAEGLTAYAHSQPHLVLCDIEMQPVDGMVFLQSLRTEQRRLGWVAPVIFLTSHAEAELVQRARRLKVDDFLIKPISKSDLERRVDRVMARASA